MKISEYTLDGVCPNSILINTESKELEIEFPIREEISITFINKLLTLSDVKIGDCTWDINKVVFTSPSGPDFYDKVTVYGERK